VQYITSSQLNVSDNVITVNVASPGVRFGGLSVFDSGSLSSEATASLFWDSQNNHWIYQRESSSIYNGGMLISGPRNFAGLGNEEGTTNNSLMKGQGGDHITSSAIFEVSGSVTMGNAITNRHAITGSVNITGSISVTGSANFYNTVADYGLSITNVQDSSQGLLIRSSDNDTGLYILNLQSSVGATSQTWVNRLVVEKGGNVGIGTATPSYVLDIAAGSNGNVFTPAARITTSTGGAGGGTILQINHTANSVSGLQILQAGASGGNYTSINNTENGYMSFATSGSERARISASGNVGIGSTAPARKLIVYGGTTNAGLEILSANGYRSAIIAGRGSSGTASDQGYFQMTDQGTATVVLDTAGNSYVNGGNFGVKTTNPTSGLLQTGDAGTTSTNTYFGTGQVRVGGGSDHGSSTVLSVAPGVVTFDRPGVGGGALTINSSGYVTLPAQPSFYIVSNGGQTDYTTNEVIIFNTARHNTGAHYNTSNGRFTAPVAGKYLFTLNVYAYPSYTAAVLLTINGAQYTGGGDVTPYVYTSADAGAKSLSFTLVWELSASDYVEVRARSTTRIYRSHSHFSGQLLS
jgi:hypothetical protein